MKLKILLGLFFLVSIIHAQIPTTNQERAYTFDNSSLVDDVDAANFTQNGTSLVFLQDRLGNATSSTQLNGDYLTSATFSFSDFSIAFWIRTSTNDANERTIFDKSERTSASFSAFTGSENGFYIYLKNGRIGVKSSRRVVANNNTGATANYLGDRFFSEVIADGTWKHIVITIDKQGTQFNTASGRNTYPYEYNYYVDGQLTQTSTENVQVGGIITGRDLSRPVDFSVANVSSGILSTTEVYQDELDDVYVYTAELTAADVSQFQLGNTLTTTATNGTISADIAPTNGTYSNGTVVELTATPDAGYQFDGWSGDATGTTNPLSVIMDSDKNITAMFSQIERALTLVATNGAIMSSGVPNSFNGNVQMYDDGDVVSLTALPDTNYQFNGWSGDATGTTNPLPVTMDADKTITAMFGLVQETLITTGTNGSISADIQPTNGTYDYGTVVELTATPDAGYQFDGWSGDATGTTNPLSVNMDADKNIVATFSLIQRALMLTSTNGFISVDVPATNSIYDNGTVVALTATPDTGYQFDGWSGDLSGTTNPISITMDADKSVTALFSLISIQRTLALSLPRDGSGAVTRDVQPTNGTYSDGTVIELTAVPTTGYQFDGWSGDLSGTTNPISITMNADKSVTPMFSIDPTASIVDNEFNNTIEIYPNPVKNTLLISLATGETLKGVEVFNLLGKKVLETNNNTIDFRSVSFGLYLLKIENDEGEIAVRKIIKK